MRTDAMLIVAWALVFAINLVPAFMPPTWAFLAFFLVRWDLPVLPLAIGAAVAATTGRIVLAVGTRQWGTRLLSEKRQANFRYLGERLKGIGTWVAPLAVLVYSFGPIPSNELFIIAGLARIRLRPIAGAFLVGRMISYTFWAYTARRVSQDLEGIFAGYWGNAGSLALQALGLAVVLVVARIDWFRVFAGDSPSQTSTH